MSSAFGDAGSEEMGKNPAAWSKVDPWHLSRGRICGGFYPLPPRL